jgi:hypothetical protein
VPQALWRFFSGVGCESKHISQRHVKLSMSLSLLWIAYRKGRPLLRSLRIASTAPGISFLSICIVPLRSISRPFMNSCLIARTIKIVSQQNSATIFQAWDWNSSYKLWSTLTQLLLMTIFMDWMNEQFMINFLHLQGKSGHFCGTMSSLVTCRWRGVSKI